MKRPGWCSAEGVLIVLVGLAAGTCSERKLEYYRGINIEPATLQVTPQQSVGSRTAGAGRYYFRFNDARERPGITHLEIDASGRQLACYDSLELDTTYHLAYRTKSQELWRDAFGLILGQSAYYYAPQYSGQGIGFLTVPNANLGCVEHPTVLQTPPDSGLLQLDAISIVRVFEEGAGFLVVAGNYAPGGDLQALSRGKVVRRENVSPDAIRASDVNTSYVSQPPAPIETLGLPLHVDATALLTSDVPTLASSPLALRWELVNLHYDRSRVVRQESTVNGRRAPRRWLRFTQTYADRVLESVDSGRSFGLTSWLKHQ